MTRLAQQYAATKTYLLPIDVQLVSGSSSPFSFQTYQKSWTDSCSYFRALFTCPSMEFGRCSSSTIRQMSSLSFPGMIGTLQPNINAEPVVLMHTTGPQHTINIIIHARPILINIRVKITSESLSLTVTSSCCMCRQREAYAAFAAFPRVSVEIGWIWKCSPHRAHHCHIYINSH